MEHFEIDIARLRNPKKPESSEKSEDDRIEFFRAKYLEQVLLFIDGCTEESMRINSEQDALVHKITVLLRALFGHGTVVVAQKHFSEFFARALALQEPIASYSPEHFMMMEPLNALGADLAKDLESIVVDLRAEEARRQAESERRQECEAAARQCAEKASALEEQIRRLEAAKAGLERVIGAMEAALQEGRTYYVGHKPLAIHALRKQLQSKQSDCRKIERDIEQKKKKAGRNGSTDHAGGTAFPEIGRSPLDEASILRTIETITRRFEERCNAIVGTSYSNEQMQHYTDRLCLEKTVAACNSTLEREREEKIEQQFREMETHDLQFCPTAAFMTGLNLTPDILRQVARAMIEGHAGQEKIEATADAIRRICSEQVERTFPLVEHHYRASDGTIDYAQMIEHQRRYALRCFTNAERGQLCEGRVLRKNERNTMYFSAITNHIVLLKAREAAKRAT